MKDSISVIVTGITQMIVDVAVRVSPSSFCMRLEHVSFEE